MKKIFGIKAVKAKGRPMVLVTLVDGTEVWIAYGQWAASCSANLQSYVGGYIAVLYYEVGDVMLSGVECTSANTIVDSFSATQNVQVVALVEADSVAKQAEEMNTLALIARKKRLAKASDATPANTETTSAEETAEQPADALNTDEVVTDTPATEPVEEGTPATEEVTTNAE